MREAEWEWEWRVQAGFKTLFGGFGKPNACWRDSVRETRKSAKERYAPCAPFREVFV